MPEKWIKERLGTLDSIVKQAQVPAYQLVFLHSRDSFNSSLSYALSRDSSPPFRIGSLSKVFVALGILKLQEQGLLDLNDPVSLHLNRPKLDNPWEATNPVRIAHLLEHSAGLDDMHFNEYYHFEDISVPLSEALERNPNSKRVRWIPGTCSSYSNVGYAIAGRVIEEVTDTAFATWMWTNLLQPLGMSQTCYPPCPGSQAAIDPADGYSREYLYTPSMGMVSTVHDLKRLCILLLRRGKLGGIQYFQPASIDRMFRSETTRASGKGWWDGEYGLGFQLWSRGDEVHARATGMVEGYLSFLNIAPAAGNASVLLCPSPDKPEQFVKQVNDLLWFPFQRPHTAYQPGPIGRLEEGTYRLLSTRHAMLDFREDVYSQIRIERVGGDWVGTLPSGSASVLIPSSNIGKHVPGRVENRVFVDRDSSGICAIQINGQYFVPTSPTWGPLWRTGATVWTWMVFGYMVFLLLNAFLRARKKDSAKSRFPLGMFTVTPYWMLLWAYSILVGQDYYLLGRLSGQSVILFLLTWAAPLVSVGLPIMWWRRFRLGIRRAEMYAGIPVMVGNLCCTGYLISYGMIPFASWSY